MKQLWAVKENQLYFDPVYLKARSTKKCSFWHYDINEAEWFTSFRKAARFAKVFRDKAIVVVNVDDERAPNLKGLAA